MSVLVKGMKMPEKCPDCNFESEHGFCLAKSPDFCGYTDELVRPDWCPLVELPEKHGRLIDAEALIDTLEHDVAIDQDSLDYEELTEINRRLIQNDKDVKQNAIDLLERTSCIIEAEGEG